MQTDAPELVDLSPEICRERIWIMNRWTKEAGNRGVTWYSQDGVKWSQLKSDLTWKARHRGGFQCIAQTGWSGL